MTDFLIGGGALVGGILLIESFGQDLALINIVAGGCIVYGLYRLVMTLVDMSE
jgi:hypothetical protein